MLLYLDLMCFNANCFDASLIMVGLSNEVLVETLIYEYIKYLIKEIILGNLVSRVKLKQNKRFLGNIEYIESILKMLV